MSKAFFSKYLPLILLGAFLLISLITVFTQSGNYGITIDEPAQDAYGHAALEWYSTLGKNTSFFTEFPDLAGHGVIFDVVVNVAQHMFPPAEHWYVRHILTALCGWLGLIVIALCGYELGGYWMAFLAALALWFYPRYYGAIYNNPKDVPAAVTTLIVVWMIFIFMNQWGQKKHFIRNSVLVGFCIGLAASVRVTAVIWYLILGLIMLGWWLLQGRRVWQEKKIRSELIWQVIAGSMIGITSLLTMMALWPYIFVSPIKNLLYSIESMSHFAWDGPVLFNGVVVPAEHLPRIYAPEWLVIGSPPALMLFMLLGLMVACIWAIKKQVIDPKVALVILAFVVPLGTIVGLHSVLYDALRQILFLVPPMILIAVYGFIQTVNYLRRRKQKTLRYAAAGLVILTLASYALVVKEMVELSPFEYTYFSPVVGGLSGAEGKFETDYWGTCSTQAKEWLQQNYQKYTSLPAPSVEVKVYLYPDPSNLLFMMPAFHADNTNPDFYIASTRYNLNQALPTYKVIHIVAAEGVPLCVVKVNPTLLQ